MNTNMDQYKRTHCRYSGEELPNPFLELGEMPLANSYVKPADADKVEFRCPLSLVFAPESGLVQLSHVVPPDLMFKNYLYVSATTKTFQKHFSDYANAVRSTLEKNKAHDRNALAVDIGSNDGTLLSAYMNEGLRAVGVDPATNLAVEANKNGRKTVNGYFDEKAVETIVSENGQASVVSANNVFAHIDDIHSVCRNLTHLLRDDGFFVTEFPYLGVMLEKLYFDMIYHEHLSYIAVKPLAYLAAKFGFQIFDIHFVPAHGGSLRVFIKKQNGPYAVQPVVGEMITDEEKKGFSNLAVYQDFANKVRKVRGDLTACIRDLKKQGKTIAGYGAPAKASTIINYCGFTREDIDYVVDDNPMKQNYLIPGAKIPIVSSARLQTGTTDYIFIFAWNFAKEILEKIGSLREHGVKFIVPLLKQDQGGGLLAEQPSYQVIA